jgi:hypothetical protein
LKSIDKLLVGIGADVGWRNDDDFTPQKAELVKEYDNQNQDIKQTHFSILADGSVCRYGLNQLGQLSLENYAFGNMPFIH